MITQPYKACDWDPERQEVYPLVQLPKVDGVRGVHNHTSFRSRTFEPFANKFTQNLFNSSITAGFDGELAAGPIVSSSLCRDTTSALNTIEGEPYVEWWIFDMVDQTTAGMGYLDRLLMAHKRIDHLQAITDAPHWVQRLRKMPFMVVRNRAEMLAVHKNNVLAGYEGSILRDPNAAYKFGRSTAKEGGYLRIKDFAHDEVLVTGVEQGKTNMNALGVDNVGYAKRSTHQENMVPNGMVGAMIGTLLKDVVVNGGKKVFPKGTPVKVAAGCLTDAEAKYYWLHPDKLLGHVVKFQHFPHGVKDKLRYTTFQMVRPAWDIDLK